VSNQSVLAPAGIPAVAIHALWTLMLWVCVAVFVAVLTMLLIALIRGMRRRAGGQTSGTSERGLARSVGAAVGLTVVILLLLLVASVATGRTSGAVPRSSAVTISVIGHQWWWEIHYEDPVPNQQVVTANEIHMPLDRPVVLKVTSRDVIHSFWAPNLQGKRDLIPGNTTAIWLHASRPGTFRAQCAEFCGMQHAHMALEVTAESDADFRRWLDARRQPAIAPADGITRTGHDVFMRARCAACHTIRGTDAAGLAGPDLTHLAARGTIGAGTLANTAAHLADWIRDPQQRKPGNQMPANPLPRDDLQPLVAYLETLR
jgi:cytochrome c oxidase subunit 2